MVLLNLLTIYIKDIQQNKIIKKKNKKRNFLKIKKQIKNSYCRVIFLSTSLSFFLFLVILMYINNFHFNMVSWFWIFILFKLKK